MYVYPTLFPQSTNREDLFRTVSIFDDDTNQPINLSGITLLTNPNGFTGNNWRVTDGVNVTTSSTSIAVPGYPVTNQLLALSLTVGLNLSIAAGDPVTIADVGGNASMSGYVLSYTPANGALSVQIGLAFQLEIRHVGKQDSRYGWDYSMWFDWGGGSFLGDAPLIQANLGTGLSIIDMGFLQINIPAIMMQQLHNRSYMIALAATDSVNTRQIFVGRLPILYGGITPMLSLSPTQPQVQFT